jgi:hypothetical protein
MKLDVEAWTRLAKENPREFERQRKIALRRAIEVASAEHRERLQAIQCRLDSSRERNREPAEAAVHRSSLIWAGFIRLRKALGKPETKRADAAAVQAAPPSAQVISLAAHARARRTTPRSE